MSVRGIIPLANHDPSALMMAREGFVKSGLRDPGHRHAAPLPLGNRTPVSLTLPNNFFSDSAKSGRSREEFRQIKAK